MAQQLPQSAEPKIEEPAAKSLSCSEMYQQFLQIDKHCEDSVESIIANFNALICKLRNSDGPNSHFQHLNNIELLRSHTLKKSIPFKWQRFLHQDTKSAFINRYYQYFKKNENDILSHSQQKVLIIGAGPAGLRLAIELALYGHRNITMIDSRDRFDRKQIVAIWNITDSDLLSFGIRDLLPKYNRSPDKKSIPITYLQHFLMRVALILGVEIRTNISFESIDLLQNKINLYNKTTCKLEQLDNAQYEILVDATGTVGALRDCPVMTNSYMMNDDDVDQWSSNGRSRRRHSSCSSLSSYSQSEDTDDTETEQKEVETESVLDAEPEQQPLEEAKASKDDQNGNNMQLIGWRKASHLKKDIFGIVANFKRTPGDHKKAQILGKAYFLFRQEFDAKKVKLENIVYYRSDLTNYVVSTVKKQSLVAQNVFVDPKLKGKKLLHRNNVNRANLRGLILNVADEWNIPHSLKENPFNVSSRGNEDFAVFEFGKLRVAKQPIKFIQRVTMDEEEEDEEDEFEQEQDMQEQPENDVEHEEEKEEEDDIDANKNEQKRAYQMIACVGDAECAPFWPKGTGVNHATIGVYMLVEIIKKMAQNSSKTNDVEFLNEIEMKARKEYDVLHSDLSDKVWHKTVSSYVPEYTIPGKR